MTERGDLQHPPAQGRRVNRDVAFEVAFGQRIRAARVAAGLSQGALGAAVGISWQQVQKYEKGKDRVSASTLQRFAATLGLHPGSFFDADLPAPTRAQIASRPGEGADGRRAMTARHPAAAWPLVDIRRCGVRVPEAAELARAGTARHDPEMASPPQRRRFPWTMITRGTCSRARLRSATSP